jgi:uncharacterized protein (DUF362 family)
VEDAVTHSDAGPAVALARCAGYGPELERLVPELLQATGFVPGRGERVLLKPNLLQAGQEGLICTHPAVVRAACRYVLDHGARALVGDSPAFGTGRLVARRIGLVEALRGLDVRVASLNRPRRVRLPFGFSLGVSALALDADRILSLPKAKAHCQMRISGAVKNCFGTVTGVRKAVAHTRHGDVGNRFESMLLELLQALPPLHSLLDGITAMHVCGPSGGEPYPLELLGASADAVALDTALYAVLGLAPEQVPLWAEALRRGLPGGRAEAVRYVREAPDAFDAAGFVLPEPLDPVTFHPVRLCVSACRRAWAKVF